MASSKLSLLKVWILLPVIAAGLWSLQGCQKSKQPSFLIIAVDRLSFNSFSCGEERPNLNSGLNTLCGEGIRFTHAYTTSVQSAAAMGSILTGLYPLQHQLHRSFDRLAPGTKMIQDTADQMGYQTYFLSGSPTILKKTGLSSGFDIFDDSSFLERKSYFVDFKYQADKFLSLIQESSDPFFTVIYNSELEALNEGESQISSLEKLDEKFYKFFNDLKQKRLWDENYIIVVGLQGDPDNSRLEETAFSNLNSDNTKVNLFVKPPRYLSDDGLFWKMDSTISLADLGLSLWNTLNEKKKPLANNIETKFPIVDFSSIWKTQNKNFPIAARKLLIEAANTWVDETSLRFAILYKNLVQIEAKKDLVFNTLTDGLESINIASQYKDFALENDQDIKTLRNQFKISLWDDYKPAWSDWVDLNREYWSKPNSRVSVLEKELLRIKKERKTQPLSAILAKHLVRTSRGAELQKIKAIDLKQKNVTERPRIMTFENIKQQSLNLALENIWGLWHPNRRWLQSNVILDNQ